MCPRTFATGSISKRLTTLRSPFIHAIEGHHRKTRQGTQRSCCPETVCDGRTFLVDDSYAGHSAAIKQQIVDMAMHASGIRVTARVLHVSPTTVIKERKKRPLRSSKCIRRCCSISPLSLWRWKSGARMSVRCGVD